MPSDSFPAAEFVVACPSMKSAVVRRTLKKFAEEHQFSTDLQETSADYIRLRMDGKRVGNDIYVEYWSNENLEPSRGCSAHALPCVEVVAFTLGSIPDDELTERAESQRTAARALRERLESACKA